jgi:hypothetical protein
MTTDTVHDPQTGALVGRVRTQRIQTAPQSHAPLTIVEETYPQRLLRVRQEAQRKAREGIVDANADREKA